jgi:hypothetical protein
LGTIPFVSEILNPVGTDGRTTDLLDAVEEHASSGSEANAAISNFKQLSPNLPQDLSNFLRSLWREHSTRAAGTGCLRRAALESPNKFADVSGQ